MKTNCWLILGTMLATTAVAQVNTNKLPEIPAPATVATPAPTATPVVAPTTASPEAAAKKTVKAKKKAVKKKVAAKVSEKAEKKSAEIPSGPVILVPGPATVVAENVNLRGQAGLQGEVVGHVKKGDVVTVIAEINLDKPKAGEPAQWAKIALPAGTKVWVDAKYVDKTTNVVVAKKLNLRGGPGENYSVLGVIEKGTSVASVSTKGDWMQIDTPTSAFAFAAAHYLKQEGGMETNVAVPPTLAATENAPAPTPAPAPAPTPTTVPDAPMIAPPANTPPPAPVTTPTPTPTPAPETVAAAPTPAPTPAPAPVATTPDMTPTPTLAPDDTDAAETDTNLPPPPPRIVTHEGMVRHSVSPVAPTYFELYDPSDDKAIDYLHTTSTNLNLNLYNGRHITVTGEEAMDVRWKDTPVITIQKIYVLPTDKTAEKPVLRPVKTK